MRKRLALTAAAAMAAALTSATPAQAAPQAAAGPGPFYWIVNADTGKALLPYQHSKDSGQPLVLSNEFDGGATHWKVRRIINDTQLENRHSHLCANSVLPNGFLRQEYCGSPGTAWTVSNFDDLWAGRPVTWRNNHTFQCMTAFGTVAKAAPCTGASTQKFRIVYVPGT
ncbi:RICIN domain-containing protein [Spirillospora sp. NPDC050679]